MIRAVFLDTFPLSLATHPKSEAEEGIACRAWVRSLADAGVEIYVPEIADYELRREAIRRKNWGQLHRLDHFNMRANYLPITTPAMHRACELWAQVRNAGMPTAHPHALDGDVILAAQALTTEWDVSEFVVATSNPAHLRRFVIAKAWHEITL